MTDQLAFAHDDFLIEQASEIRRLASRSGQDVLEIGKRLVAVKDRLPHGEFGPWIEREFGWSYQTAARFMSVVRAFGEISHGERFEAKALYALASGNIPDETRQEYIARAEAGETIRYRDVRAAITPAPASEPSEPKPEPPLLAVVDLETGEVVDPEPETERPALPRHVVPEAYDVAANMTLEQAAAFDAQTARYDEPHRVGQTLLDCEVALRKADRLLRGLSDDLILKYTHDSTVQDFLRDTPKVIADLSVRLDALRTANHGGLRRVQ